MITLDEADAGPAISPQAAESHVVVRQLGAVGLVVFSRTPGNHFSTGLIRDLANAFETLDADPEVRATVLASEGKNFCAGADLVGGREDPPQLYEQALRLFALRKPMVAAVQGAAIGGGLGLALAADFRFVTPESRLAANFVKLGIHPGFGITLTLPRVVGAQKAADILLTGRRLTGTEAAEIGLADRLVEASTLRNAAVDYAAEIAANAPLAVEAARDTLREGFLDDLRRRTEREAAEQIRLRVSLDFAEGVRSVTERRPGRWVRG